MLTDHKSLTYFQTQPMLSGRQTRWLEALSKFDFAIEYVKGDTNIVADALSRRADLHDSATPLDRPLRYIDPQPTVAARSTLAQLRTSKIFTTTSDSITAELNRVSTAQEQRLAELRRQQERQRAVEAATLIRPPDPDRPRPNTKGAIVMPSQRCTANNKRLLQCGSRTTKGQYCWTHLRSLCNLRIKASSIPLAGMGLFAERDFAAGEHLADYTGDLIVLRRDGDGGPYCLQLNSRQSIDAARTNSAPGRTANDPRGSGRDPNASFVLNTRNRTGRLQASKQIKKGEEIFVSYGQGYWAAHGPKRKSRRGQGGGNADANLNEVITTFSSSIADDLRRAGAADAGYTAALTAPRTDLDPNRVSDGFLYYDDRLCIPSDPSLRTRLMQECHDSDTGGHLGKDKTTEQLKRRFYWSGMDSDIQQYVTTCDACQRNKPSQQATMGALRSLPIPPSAWHTVSMDLITALPQSASGHDAIVVFVCKLTKMVHYAACSTTVTAPELAEIFLRTVIRQHGLPVNIISDRDPRFTAGFWRALWAKLGTTLTMSTAYHPQTDGQTENSNKTLETMLRSVVNFEQTDWDSHLHLAEFAVNNSKNATTGYTPFFLNHGHELRSPIDAAIDSLTPPPTNEAADSLSARLLDALTRAQANIKTAQERQAHYADQHRRDVTFKVGDRVLLSSKNLQLLGDAKRTRKFTSRFIGPYSITRVINDNAYELQLPPNLRIHNVINISQLKQYHDGAASFPHRAPTAPRPEPESYDAQGVPIHVVHRILDKRGQGRRMQYLVLWTGYPPEEATWEPAVHLAGSPAAIADYENAVRDRPRPRRQRRR